MGMFDKLLNIFQSSKQAPQAQAMPSFRTVQPKPKKAANAGTQKKHRASAKPQTPQHKITQTKSSSSTPVGAANWFNGIGTTSSTQSKDITVYDLSGHPLNLTATDCKASGGEGTVYCIPRKQSVLVKIYKDELLQNPTKRSEIEKRIFDMLAFDREIDRQYFAWPRGAVCNKQGQVIGFAMNNCNGISLRGLSGIRSIQENFRGWTRYELALTAQDFLSKLMYLASKNIFVNDFNPANFLVDQKGNVSFIDCDSFQVPGEKGRINITRTYFASHVAPELLKTPQLLAQPRNIHQVEFGAALTVFNILMCGLQPYSYYDPHNNSACGTPDENLLQGRCPLGTGADCRFPLGPWYNLWSYVPFRLKGSFIKTFRDGHSAPSQRASLKELHDNVSEFLHVMGFDRAYMDLNPSRPRPRREN